MPSASSYQMLVYRNTRQAHSHNQEVSSTHGQRTHFVPHQFPHQFVMCFLPPASSAPPPPPTPLSQGKRKVGINVQVYPEGGQLLVGALGAVYIEVRDLAGNPLEVTGRVRPNTETHPPASPSKLDVSFSTSRRGRARVVFTPQASPAVHIVAGGTHGAPEVFESAIEVSQPPVELRRAQHRRLPETEDDSADLKLPVVSMVVSHAVLEHNDCVAVDLSASVSGNVVVQVPGMPVR